MAQSPFPGMDPYLESPDLWPDVHNSLMNIFREQLGDLLAPKYIAELDTQIVIDRFPDEPDAVERVVADVAITQPRLIREGSAEAAVVAAPLRLRCRCRFKRAWSHCISASRKPSGSWQ